MTMSQKHSYIYAAVGLAASVLFAAAVFAQTADRYEKAQVVYRAENITRLFDAAERLGEATAEPLTLDGLPGEPTVDVSAKDDELTIAVSGAGAYRVDATVFSRDREALDKLSGFRGRRMTSRRRLCFLSPISPKAEQHFLERRRKK
ncbi:MAG: hypothetical protein HYV25_01045 [Candidatus Harrisonbacteria bacterium]|nr:hypothetical protein [Candidatus Harrisonbacteria bacterium]